MRQVPLAPPTATMIPAGAVYGLRSQIWLAVFFAVGDGFVKAYGMVPGEVAMQVRIDNLLHQQPIFHH